MADRKTCHSVAYDNMYADTETIQYRKLTVTRLFEMAIDAQLLIFEDYERRLANPNLINDEFHRRLLVITQYIFKLTKLQWHDIRYNVLRRGAKCFIENSQIDFRRMTTIAAFHILCQFNANEPANEMKTEKRKRGHKKKRTGDLFEYFPLGHPLNPYKNVTPG